MFSMACWSCFHQISCWSKLISTEEVTFPNVDSNAVLVCLLCAENPILSITFSCFLPPPHFTFLIRIKMYYDSLVWTCVWDIFSFFKECVKLTIIFKILLVFIFLLPSVHLNFLRWFVVSVFPPYIFWHLALLFWHNRSGFQKLGPYAMWLFP